MVLMGWRLLFDTSVVAVAHLQVSFRVAKASSDRVALESRLEVLFNTQTFLIELAH